jgi:HlyD family secretion protein
VAEGQTVKRGTILLVLDDSIQRATVEQLQSQAQAASTLLNELKAQPRKETLDVAEAQVMSAQALLKTAQDELDKQETAYDVNPKSISKDALDSAANAVRTAKANLEVACKAARPNQSGRLDLRHKQSREAIQCSVQILFVGERAANTRCERQKMESSWRSTLP